MTEDIVSRVRDIAARVILAQADAHDAAGTFPAESMKALADAGLYGLTIAKDHGGLAEGPSTFVKVVEEIASADPSAAMIYVMHVCAIEVIKQSSLPQKGDVLKAAAEGRHLSTLAFSESGSRSHFWAPVSKVKVEDGWHVLNCRKSFVTSAGRADSYIVSSQAHDAAAPTESTLYFVLRETPGVMPPSPWNGLGLRGNDSAPVTLTNCAVPAEHRVSDEKVGFNVMLGVVLPWFQMGSAAVANGLARGAVESTARHLSGTQFEHLGEALSSLPTVRARLARAVVQLDASRALTAQTAQAVEQPGDETMLRVLEVKACAGEMALDVTDACMRLCGGAAFSRSVAVERYFRDARAGAVMAPTTDVLYDFIGKARLGLPLF